MGTRDHYDMALAALDQQITDMAQNAADAVTDAMQALKTQDSTLAEQVVQGDDLIDRAEHTIEHTCLGLISSQQPVASDLRKISAAMKMVTDIERIGDAAADISEIVIHLKNETISSLLDCLTTAGTEATGMLKDAIIAYRTSDLKLAEQVISRDDLVDEAFAEIKRQLADYFAANHDQIDCAIDYLMIAKYLERLGDHAVNLAEWAQFRVTGIHKRERIV